MYLTETLKPFALIVAIVLGGLAHTNPVSIGHSETPVMSSGTVVNTSGTNQYKTCLTEGSQISPEETSG